MSITELAIGSKMLLSEGVCVVKMSLHVQYIEMSIGQVYRVVCLLLFIQ